MPPHDDPFAVLPLSRAGLDRAAHRRGDPDLIARALADPDTRVVDLVQDRMLVVEDGQQPRLAFRAPLPDDGVSGAFFLGQDTDGLTYLAVTHPDGAAPERLADRAGAGWQSLRQAPLVLSDLDTGVFTTAQALAHWHHRNPCCPLCGTPTDVVSGGWVRRCPRDGSEHYPRSDPAVIMSIVDADDRLLLGRGASWPAGRFSVLAGFVEPGESLESAVAREVLEEVGVPVTDVAYLGNQPWPFPASLMVAFTCRALAVDLHVDEHELAQARWFSRDEYRAALAAGQILAPVGISIALRIIERWYGEPVPRAAAWR